VCLRQFPIPGSCNCEVNGCLVVITITSRNGSRNPWKGGNEVEFTLCFKGPMVHWLGVAVCHPDSLGNITEPSRRLFSQ